MVLVKKDTSNDLVGVIWLCATKCELYLTFYLVTHQLNKTILSDEGSENIKPNILFAYKQLYAVLLF